MKKGLLFSSTMLFLFLLYSSMVYAQDRTISGTVTDGRGETLPGVTVMVRGTSIGTVTDIDGGFQLNVPATADFLVFTFVGMRRVEIPLSAETTYRVTMEPEAYGLDEVVVVGYGSQVRANLTGAVDMVTSERLENRPITSVGAGLQGLIPNLNVTVYSGDPTRSTDLNVRGFESITGGEPLILVDGVPMSLDRVNPSDIESITVLKDAAAGAIYGARAAFGVIMVETKRGATEGMNIRFSSEFGIDVPIFHIDPIDHGYEYALLRNQAHERDGGDPYYGAEFMERLKRYWDDPENNPSYAVVDGSFENYGFIDLHGELLNNSSPHQKHDLSISGVSDRSRYYSSFGYLSTDGFVNNPANQNYKRYNVMMKGDLDITDWFNIDQQISVNSQVSSKPANQDLRIVARNEPIRAYRVPYLEDYPELEGEYWDHEFSLLGHIERGGRNKWQNSDTWLKTGITLTPFDRFRVRSDFSYNSFRREAEVVQPQYQMVSTNLEAPSHFNTIGNNTLNVRRDYNQYYVFNLYGEYEIADQDLHYVKAMAGFNQEWGMRTHVAGQAFEPVSATVVDIGATTGTQSITGGKDHVAIRGAFYRLNYIYDGKYLFEANGRYDGTSRFGTDDRFGFFPSFSAAWRISAENFMYGVSHIFDDIKIRASYGTLGNQLLGNRFYPYIASMTITDTNLPLSGAGNIPLVRMPGMVSPNLTWESVVTQNLGLDLTLLDYKLNATFDMYTRETKDMLMRKSYPSIIGAAAPDENAADLMTRGWELSIRWRDRVSTDFNYDISFVLSDWVSEITKYENPTNALNDYYVGMKLGEVWGFETVGIFQSNEAIAAAPSQEELGPGWKAGDIQYADLNNDGVINRGNNTLDDPGDRKIIGNENPRYSFGLNTGLNYKSFGLSVFLQGVGKRDFDPGSAQWTWFYPWRAYAADKSWVTDSWTPDNPDAYWPEMGISGVQNRNFQTQSRYLQDASYIRLKSLTLSYNLPTTLTSRVGLAGVRVYASGQNLWELSNIRRPLDPEYVYSNIMDFPLMRTYAAGIIVNL